MGCAQSRIDNEESVARCKDRKCLMKEAVVARNAFAAAHSGYAISLKNTGAALSDYGHGEAEVPLLNPQQIPAPLDSTPPPPPMMDNLPPPPPLPNFSPSPVPIKRTVSMLAMPVKSRKEFDASLAIEEEEEEEENDDDDEEEHHEGNDNNNTKEDLRKDSRGSPAGTNVDALENNINEVGFSDHGGFDSEIEPKTPERPKKVAMAVEDPEVNDDKGKQQVHIEHSKTAPADFRRMVKVVPGVNLLEVLNEIDDHFLKASESAQEVSKLLEATRLHYYSNFADNRGHIDHSERVMRVITWNRPVRGMTNCENGKGEFDSEDYETHATILELLAWEKKLYDDVKEGELVKLEYKRKLASLNKQKKHGASTESLERTKTARNNKAPPRAHHHERTIQLHSVVQEWHSQFDKLVTRQKQYILSLYNWLRLNLIPIESNLKEKVSSPPRAQSPTIKTLLHTWHDCLEKLPDEVAKSTISSFAAVIKSIIIHQDEEVKLKEKCEETRKELLRKSQAFEEWYHKYKQRRFGSDETDAERGEDANAKDDAVSESQFAVESLKKRLEEEVEAHEKHCIQVREIFGKS
ncbi:serine/threonine-protein kinase AFC3-like [Hibiscus syriacus]|uniref:Serine/threonine-protein kinase AFC3-like n=1 Tax=Hibiscus syriacus TaxID=106335 RepID=A0A6A3CTM3_HIBSY|nr:serine/threonine-protein kinase AFC3-like [Hibiscus syriacus]